MKKITSLLLTAAFLTSAASCGRKTADVSETSGKTVVTLAALPTRNDPNLNRLDELAEKFNSRSEVYTLTVKKYPFSENDPHQPLNQLNMDILSGDIPDIIAAPPESIGNLGDKGYLTDLYPLLDDSEEIGRGDFLPNVLPSLEKDGKLMALFEGFTIKTMAVMTSSLTPELQSWSYADMESVFRSMPRGKRLFAESKLSRGNVLYSIYLPCMADSYIDFSNNTCDFSAVAQRLDFLSELSDGKEFAQEMASMSEQEWQVWNKEQSGGLIRGDVLVDSIELGGINAALTSQLAYFGGAPVTFIGYPSENGSRNVTKVDVMYAVMDKSECKKGAFEFLTGLFRNSYQKDMSISWRGLPVTESALEALTADDIKLNALSIYEPVSVLPDSEPYVISDENVALLKEFIRTEKLSPYTHSDVEDIIVEECMAALEGGSSHEQCAYLLDDRISTYLSERG